MNPIRILASLALAGGLCLLAGCATQSVLDRSRDFARVGDYQHAFEVLDAERARQLAGGGEVDAELAAAHEQARRSYLLDRARTRTFQEQVDEALADLALLEQVMPGDPRVDALRARANRKKALRIVGEADDLFAKKDLAGAMQGYLVSQRLVPDLELAAEGIAKVREEMARLDARAQQQFLEAVRKMPEFRYVEVQWHAANVIHNTPDREEARELRRRARHENAAETFRRAAECQRADQFGAALMLYKATKELDPEFEGVDEAIEGMKREIAALGLVESAQIAMRSDQFDEADDLLKRAFESSVQSRGTISELMIQLRRKRGEHSYQQARDLEVLGKKAEALAAFQALTKDWPDGLEDEQARAAALAADVAGAAEEWQAAEQAEAEGDLEKALDHYVNAERFYPGWRDGAARIDRLKKAIAEQKAKAGGGEPAGAGDPGGAER